MLETTSKIVRNGQLTIPSKIRKQLHLHDGDLLRFDVHDGQIVITPVTLVDKDQKYFYSKKWQESIVKAETAIAECRYTEYSSADDAVADLGLDDD